MVNKTISNKIVTNSEGYFGDYGGLFVPETLMGPLEALNCSYTAAKADLGFQKELDQLLYKLHLDTDLKMGPPGMASVADGVFGLVRWEVMGLHVGPNFPAQAPASKAVYDQTKKVFEASGILDHVEWEQAIVEA